MKLNERKERLAIITAIISFAIGWGLTIAGFCIPPRGEVSGSVLAVLGEAMVYAASVLGVALYFNQQMTKFKADTRAFLETSKAE